MLAIAPLASQPTGNAKGQRDALTSIAHVYADERVAPCDRAIEYAMQVRQSRASCVADSTGSMPAIDDFEASRRWFETQKNTRFLRKSEEELAQRRSQAGRASPPGMDLSNGPFGMVPTRRGRSSVG